MTTTRFRLCGLLPVLVVLAVIVAAAGGLLPTGALAQSTGDDETSVGEAAAADEAVAVDDVGADLLTDSERTVVSLTFDDGRASQWTAFELLERRGVVGTFYLNSGLLGTDGYLTWQQAEAIAAAGNEIGGHTVSHRPLTALTPDEQRREICVDRASLLGSAFEVQSFAYPFSNYDDTTVAIAEECGYNSARIVGGTTQDGPCAECPPGELLTPPDLYRVRSAPMVDEQTTVEDLKHYVTRVEQSGGGWVVVVFHDVCEGCSDLAITPDAFDEFLEWLTRRDAESTVIATVADVVGGTTAPEVLGPPPAPRDPARLVVNPSFEEIYQAGEGVARATQTRCWQHVSVGDVDASFSRTSGEKLGSASERIEIFRGGDGRATLLVRQDLGDCAIPATEGDGFRVSVAYRSTASPLIMAYYRDEVGAWHYWSESPRLEVSEREWKKVDWTSPAVPEGATAVSFGVAIDEQGSVSVDHLDAVAAKPARAGQSRGVAAWYPTIGGALFLLVVGLAASAGTRTRPRRAATPAA